jgi:intein/homing endonuclease
MARRWTTTEEAQYRDELYELYTVQNKSIKEISPVLRIAESTVFDRMKRLGLRSTPERKQNYLNTRKAVTLPDSRTTTLAEFIGIMLGDGHVSHFQTIVTLGTKELAYVEYVADLMGDLFNTKASICIRADGYRDVYMGSTLITAWLRAEGLAQNKVKSQVDVPEWIFEREEFMNCFLRGFFDTDGSIYRLRFGRQISLTNKSVPLLNSLRMMLIALGYKASAVSADCVYLTRKDDVDRFFKEVRPANEKHRMRYEIISNT